MWYQIERNTLAMIDGATVRQMGAVKLFVPTDRQRKAAEEVDIAVGGVHRLDVETFVKRTSSGLRYYRKAA